MSARYSNNVPLTVTRLPLASLHGDGKALHPREQVCQVLGDPHAGGSRERVVDPVATAHCDVKSVHRYLLDQTLSQVKPDIPPAPSELAVVKRTRVAGGGHHHWPVPAQPGAHRRRLELLERAGGQ